jgi:predicted permease
VRAAVGGRGRLVQQFLAESVVLGLAGGLAGLLVAYWSTQALVALGPSSIPRLHDVGIDWRVLAFTVTTAVVTSVVFGLVPALATTGGALARFISTAGRGSVGHGRTRVRKVLVVCEMSLAVVLLVGAGLLMRSYQRLSDVDPGFAPDHLLTFTVSLPETTYTTAAANGQFVENYVARLATRPGVAGAAAVFGLPLDTNFTASSSFRRNNEPDAVDTPSAGMRVVTPDYFRTVKIPLRAGRLFDAHDNEASPEVVIVNEEAARRFWPGADPIGQQIKLGVRLVSGVRSGQKTIVGIVGDVKWSGLDAVPPPEVYLPYAQQPVDGLTIVVRTTGDPASFAPVARVDLASLDRELLLCGADDGQSIRVALRPLLALSRRRRAARLRSASGVWYLVSRRTRRLASARNQRRAGSVVRVFRSVMSPTVAGSRRRVSPAAS